MKRTLMAVTLAGATLACAAAWSQPGGRDEWRGPEIIIQPAPQEDWNRRDDERQLGIDTRQARIRERIQRGFKSGRLTGPEARWMHRQLEEIAAHERAYETDGRLGRRESARLHEELDALSARLRSELRDDDRRY
jgi:opacity protein-like surface antigen